MKKVIIGISGGVDSAVAAMLLINQGYNVEGLFMRNWDSDINNDTEGQNEEVCPQEQDLIDAENVCKHLGIKLHTINFVKEYWDYVFTYFLEELKKGRTPNPDILCNKFIKFDLFKKEAEKLGADYIATGHYTRVKNNQLLRGLDNNKDQSYFLSSVKKEAFSNVLFPIGEYNKDEIRKLAKKHDIPVYDKKDSTGICFIGERNWKNFLKNYIPPKEGNIIDIKTKEVLGTHNGLMNFTIGQRKGLNIGGTEQRLFVVGKNLEENILYVCEGDNNEYLMSDSAIITNFNWITTTNKKELTAKFRYRQEDVCIELETIDEKTILVKYKEAKAVTPGQACVLYDGEICLGGGTIDKVYKNNEKLDYL